MSSEVAICNMALSRIGNSQRINALDEASIEAEQCSLFYEQTRDLVLRDFPWGFATAFASLAQVAINPDPNYPYAYAMPSDCLKIRGIVNQLFPDGYWPFPGCIQRPQVPRIAYRVISGTGGSYIATSATPATLEYTARIESPEAFDTMFVSALAWRLAQEVAPALAKDATTAQRCAQAYQAELNIAASNMLNEGANDFQPESSFITGRGQ